MLYISSYFTCTKGVYALACTNHAGTWVTMIVCTVYMYSDAGTTSGNYMVTSGEGSLRGNGLKV